ncbi:DUF202 domain-containing protein [Microbacterium hibisci]|uniref:DUF202 domain-containing protein n=1 Tax=Microbacterium hibisci TaxID=2036000 RepID=UPI001943B71D|nr:DUF202 domain-containing protein [Microbacterium hibisci]
MTDRRVFDPGLQPERTELAWRRTALAIGVGSLVALRVLPAAASDSAQAQLLLAPGIAGLAFAVVLWTLARARHLRVNRALVDDDPRGLPGSALLFALTLFVVGCGGLSAVVVLTMAAL